jgi:hypothetical protein
MASPAQGASIYFQAGFTDDLYSFDTVTLTQTFIGDMGFADSWGFAFSPTGILYGHNRATASLYTIDTTTGAATLVGATGIAAEDLTFDAAGTSLYATAGGSLYSLNPLTGAAALVGSLGFSLDGLTLSPSGTIYGVDGGSIYSVNVGVPSVTLVGSTSGADETFDFGPGGILYGHGDDGFFYTIDTTTFLATVLGPTPGIALVFGSAVRPDVAAVPEPGTVGLIGAGLIALAMRLRRRRA